MHGKRVVELCGLLPLLMLNYCVHFSGFSEQHRGALVCASEKVFKPKIHGQKVVM